jgi:hypothetical protein
MSAGSFAGAAIDRDPAIKVLVAKRRDTLEEDFIDESRYDRIDDRGHKIRELPTASPAGTDVTIDSDVTVTHRPTPSTTSDVEMLRLEAEMLADGYDLDNPHLPDTEDTLEEAVAAIKSDGNTPTWEVLDGECNPPNWSDADPSAFATDGGRTGDTTGGQEGER